MVLIAFISDYQSNKIFLNICNMSSADFSARSLSLAPPLHFSHSALAASQLHRSSRPATTESNQKRLSEILRLRGGDGDRRKFVLLEKQGLHDVFQFVLALHMLGIIVRGNVEGHVVLGADAL